MPTLRSARALATFLLREAPKYIYFQFINIEVMPRELLFIPEQSLSNTGSFSTGNITAFFSLESLASTSALYMGAF